MDTKNLSDYKPLIKAVIFALDDSSSTLGLIKETFDKCGMLNYVLYNDPKKMLSEFTDDVQVCLIDHYLNASMTGLDVLKKIRHEFPLCQCLYMSNQRDMDTAIEVMNLGCTKYIRKDKPGFLDTMIEYVMEAIIESDKRLRKTLTVSARIQETIDFFEKVRNEPSNVFKALA